MPSLSDSSAATRAWPHVGFSLTISEIKTRRSMGSRGLPPSPRHFQRQKSWNARACHAIKVSGFTITKAFRQSNQRDQSSSKTLAEALRSDVAFLVERQLFPEEQILGDQGNLWAEQLPSEPQGFLKQTDGDREEAEDKQA